MSRRKPTSVVRHRRARPPLGARVSAAVGRGAVVAVVGGVALVVLIVVAALTGTSDQDSGSRWADGRPGPGADTTAQPRSAPVPEPSATTAAADAASFPSSSSPSARPSATGTTSAPAVTSSPAPSASPGRRPKHHGKPPWSISHPKPGGHGPGGRH